MDTFNKELFLMDLEKIDSNPEKIKFVVDMMKSVKDKKNNLIEEMKFENAAE